MASQVSRLRAELATLFVPGPRMVDELECLLSVLLAILLAHLIGAHNVAWAAFTGFVVMRGHVAETLLRGILRLVGTTLGAGLGLLIAPYAVHDLLLASLSAAVIGAIGLYGMLTAKRAYAWLLFALTFEIILLDKIEHPAIDALAFAQSRLLEVGAGTVACLTVSLLSTLTARRRWPATPQPPAERVGWHPGAARHAAQTGIALALLPPLHALFAIAELQQAGVTVMAVMIVPVAGLGASGFVPVSRRLLHRAIGCLAGGLLAGCVILLARGSAPMLIAGTCLGIFMGRHLENSGRPIAYVGLQFTLAVLVVLVPDSYADAAIDPALRRLTSILIGMALLEPVLLAWHLLAPKDGAARPVADLREE